MTPSTRNDALILAWLEEGPTGLTVAERRAIADAAELVAQRRAILPRWRPDTRRLLVFATAIVALAVATSVLLIALIGESPTPSPSATLTAAPSQTEASTPAPCDGAGTDVQWSGRVRTDLAGMPNCGATGLGDPRDADVPGIDIVLVRHDASFQPDWRFHLAGFPQAAATLDPDETVIEYGFVFETSGDDIADYVVGINNDALQQGDFRVWVMDLAADTNEERVGPPYGFPVEFSHPDERAADDPSGSAEMYFTFLGSPPWGPGPESPRFYAWASVTSGTEVTAWDYAPDFGWLGGPGALPGIQSDELPFILPYPAPVRVEPQGDPIIRSPTPLDPPAGETNAHWSLSDDVGETDVATERMVDLAELELSWGCLLSDTICVDFTTETPLVQPSSNPFAEWLAYGLAVDTDSDGDVDLRLGMHNFQGGHRGWYQAVDTGETERAWTLGSSPNLVRFSHTEYPWAPESSPTLGRLWLGRQLAQWQHDSARFYLWSALVRDGQLIGWDFAPNEGWIELPLSN